MTTKFHLIYRWDDYKFYQSVRVELGVMVCIPTSVGHLGVMVMKQYSISSKGPLDGLMSYPEHLVKIRCEFLKLTQSEDPVTMPR